MLFSVEKRRKSQLFDKDKWQQQRLVFAGESDEDQNSQEGDCSVDSEVSSPAMDDDSRKKWLANTSVNRCDECLIHFFTSYLRQGLGMGCIVLGLGTFSSCWDV